MIIRLLLGFLFFSFPAYGGSALSLTGDFTPGALIIGQTDPGSTVSMDGKPVRVSGDGRFLLGLSRDASGHVELTLNDNQTYRYDIIPREYKIQRIDGLLSNQVSPDPATLERIARERVLITDVRKLDSIETWFADGFVWPVTGPISGVFGSQRILNGEPRNPHNGVDIAAPRDSTIVAMGDGKVVLVHDDMFYTGKTVMIDHGHGLSSVYVHMDSLSVTQGMIVTKGTPIGTLGMTGRATGPNLHWGVTLFSTHLDPMLVVGPMVE